MSTNEFVPGIRALNASLGGGRAPFSDEQLEVLVEFIDKDKDGYACLHLSLSPCLCVSVSVTLHNEGFKG